MIQPMRSLLLSLVAAASLSAQAAPSDSAVRAILKERVDAGRFVGVAVGFVSRDNQRRVIAYGPNAGVQPFDGNTVFEIGSITKTFTASILADMVKKGEVSLDDPVVKYLPAGTIIPERDGKKITLVDLATQSSGLPRMPDNFAPRDNGNPYADYTPAQMYDFLARYKLPRAIGEKYEYSNLGVGLLGQALSRRAGKDYESVVTARVLKPLGMKDTRIALNKSMQARLAPGHTESGAPAKNWDLPTFAGAGALRSTVNDMLTFVRANADSTSKPLGATLAMTHGARKVISPAMAIGLAWHRLKTPAGNMLVWHNGGTGGYRTFAGYVEATGQGIVVLSNTSQSVDEIGFHLLDASVPLPPLPKVRKEVPLPAETLEKYVGTFELAPKFALVITREGAQLYAQATDQPRFPLFAEADGEFFLKVVDAQLSFTKDSSGVVTGLVLHQNGANVPGKKR
jgi:CubicO group peptidase (beta-lactamase class C family)